MTSKAVAVLLNAHTSTPNIRIPIVHFMYVLIVQLQHVNRMPRNRLPRVMKRYSPTGRRNHGRPLKRLLDT